MAGPIPDLIEALGGVDICFAEDWHQRSSGVNNETSDLSIEEFAKLLPES